jgi:hypothetical protein
VDFMMKGRTRIGMEVNERSADAKKEKGVLN